MNTYPTRMSAKPHGVSHGASKVPPASANFGQRVSKLEDAKAKGAAPRTRAFSPPLIDLVELGRGRAWATGKSFAADIALMADFAIQRDMTERELGGIRACLEYRLLTLEWRSYLWGFPLPQTHSFPRGTAELEQQATILSDSLIASVLRYRGALNQQGMGLRHIILSDLVKGLEWACRLSRSRNLVDLAAAKHISVLELDSYLRIGNP